MLRNKKIKKGFTLVEMLVAVAIFMMVVTVAMSALMSIINANRKARAIQSVVSNVNFVIESISRDIRMGSDYNNVIDNTTINYISPSGDRIYYHFVSPDLDKKINGFLSKCTGSCDNFPTNYSQITSPDVNILSLAFYVVKDGDVQPKVIIIMEGEAGNIINAKSKFNLQTTASQRSMKE